MRIWPTDTRLMITRVYCVSFFKIDY